MIVLLPILLLYKHLEMSIIISNEKLEVIQTVQQSIIIYVWRPFTSERSEPSSRNFLIGEQPNPWELLHPQDKLSRHRGAELRRRYELLGATSLLALE